MGHLKNMLGSGTGVGVGQKSRLAWGKIRRLCLGAFQSGYIKSKEQSRQGECLRCGTCCKLLYACPHLEELEDGATECRIHEERPINCRIFPVDARDLKDRDIIAGKLNSKPCGFTFVE